LVFAPAGGDFGTSQHQLAAMISPAGGDDFTSW